MRGYSRSYKERRSFPYFKAAHAHFFAGSLAASVSWADILDDAPLAADIILVGDLSYEETLAEHVTALLDRRLAADIEVLVGARRATF